MIEGMKRLCAAHAPGPKQLAQVFFRLVSIEK